MSQKITIGPTREGTIADWVGDEAFAIVSSISTAASRHEMIDGLTDYNRPNFLVQHTAYDGNGDGINAYFPETEHFRATRFTNWIPTDINIGHNGDSGLGTGHLTVLDPNSYQPFYTGCMDMSVASFLATVLTAKTNPGRPEVSLPSEVVDTLGGLRDLPSNIYQSGKRALKAGRETNPARGFGHGATVNFGILPLVSDVIKLSRLSDLADKRAIELSNLARKGGSRVHKVLFKGTSSIVQTEGFNDLHLDARFPGSVLTITTSALVWGTTHWIPESDAFHFVNEEGQVNRSLIKGLLLGTSAYKDKIAYLRDAWELVPWSWAADWCGNFGDYLDSHANTSIASFGPCYVMLQMTTHKRLQTPAGTISLTSVSKERSIGSPSLALRAPFLSPHKMSILTEIAGRHGSRGKPRHAFGGDGGD